LPNDRRAKNTVVKLLAEIGSACAEYQDTAFRNLTCKHIQCDEYGHSVMPKRRMCPDKEGQVRLWDVWTFTAICADSKLVPSWYIGRRDLKCATTFMSDLAGRLSNRVQLTTDGHAMYLDAVERAFGSEIDFSQLVKLYGTLTKARRDTVLPSALAL